MKKMICLLVIIIIVTMSSCKKNEYTRLRILAASNEKEDIELKNMIKDIIKDLFDENILLYQILDKNTLTIELGKRLDKCIFNNLSIEQCISYYPAKSFNNKMIPSGNYDTLLIKIGKGMGHNFWTLLYPEYYGFEFEETNEIEYRSYIYDLFH